MFDLIKMTAPGKYAEVLKENPDFKFIEVGRFKGEGDPPGGGFTRWKAEILGFIVTVFLHVNEPNKVKVKGSFHKQRQNGKNYLDFPHSEFCDAVTHFCTTVGIPPEEFTVHFFEFGVNIPLSDNVAEFLEGIKTMNRRRPNRNDFANDGLQVWFSGAQFNVKLYDKGTQYGLEVQLLRYEIKVVRMDFVKNKKIHIHTLADLMSGKYNGLLLNLLLLHWDSLVICPIADSRPEKIAHKTARENYLKGLNPEWWTTMTAKAYRATAKKFRKRHVAKYGMDKQRVIRLLIQQIWKRLSGNL